MVKLIHLGTRVFPIGAIAIAEEDHEGARERINPQHLSGPAGVTVAADGEPAELDREERNALDRQQDFDRDLRAQHQLLTTRFGLSQLALVTGGSMGAQQTYEWAVRYPDMVKRAAPLAGTAKNTIHDQLFADTLIEAITSDPGFNGGWYRSHMDVRDGLRRHAKLWGVMGWSTEFYAQGRMAALGFSSLDDFITNFMNGFFGVMDPNALLAMAWKWRNGDVSRHTGGDLAAALGRIKAKTYVMPISTDMFFPPVDCEREAMLIPGAVFRPIQSIDGHLALFGADPGFVPQVDAAFAELLATPA